MRRVVVKVSAAVVILVLGSFVLGVLVMVTMVATGTTHLHVIASSTMEPTLHCARPALGCEGSRQDHVVALARFVSYDRGDIVTFEPSPRAEAVCGMGGAFVKRIIGLPGETVELRRDERASLVYVDGRRLEEPNVDEGRSEIGPERTFEVPDDHFFVLGDNRLRSCDSRHFGTVAKEDLVGKVFMTYWPPQRISFR